MVVSVPAWCLLPVFRRKIRRFGRCLTEDRFLAYGTGGVGKRKKLSRVQVIKFYKSHLHSIFYYTCMDATYADHQFPVSLQDKYLDHKCSNKLGIFKDAFEFPSMWVKSLAKRVYYCYCWGIHSISAFGHNYATLSYID